MYILKGIGRVSCILRRYPILSGENSQSNVICSGENAVITVEIEPSQNIDDLTVGILIRDKYGQDIFGTNTFHHKVDVTLKKDEVCRCLFKLRMSIGTGKYTLTAALHSKDTHVDDCFHWADNIASFQIAGNYDKQYVGICKLFPEIDVIVQKQVMETIEELHEQLGAAVILIGHDMGLMAQFAERLAVMYAGRLVEVGPIREVFHGPLHPYTQLLISSVPLLDEKGSFRGIPGITPSLLNVPPGCNFHPRCPQAKEICSERVPSLVEMAPNRWVACHRGEV